MDQMSDQSFYNMGAEGQAKEVKRMYGEARNILSSLHERLRSMGATGRAMDISESIQYLDGAFEEV